MVYHKVDDIGGITVLLEVMKTISHKAQPVLSLGFREPIWKKLFCEED